MFKELFSLLKKEDLVHQSMEDTQEMLDRAASLYQKAVQAFEKNSKAGFEIYELDQDLNSREKKIRRKILEHLSANPKQDVVASLVLTSIVIYIERIGDYSKNIYELIDLYGSGETISIDALLIKASKFIGSAFHRVGKAFIDADADLANHIITQLEKTKKDLNSYIYQYAAKQTDRSTRRTIVNVLYSRYLKRVAAHLVNIATSIACPFDQIGFYHKK